MRRFLLLLLVPALGCSTIELSLKVHRPAHINIGRYKQLAVEPIKSDPKGEMTDMLKSKLADSNRFTILDRQNLVSVQAEQKLAASGAAADTGGPQLGKTLVASAVLNGIIEESSYREEIKTVTVPLPDMSGNLVNHQSNTRVGYAVVHATLQITDVETGQLVKSKRFDAVEELKSAAAFDKPPPPLNGEAMLEHAKQSIVDQFVKAITPHTEAVHVKFFKDGKIPQMETAATLVKVGQYDDAIKSLTEALDAGDKSGIPSNVMGMAYWDRALAYEYAGQYGPARADVKKAFVFTNNADLMEELRNIDHLEKDTAAFTAQTTEPSDSTAAVGQPGM